MENVIALAITLLVLGFVGFPLLKERKQEDVLAADQADENTEVGRLLSQKDTALTAIRELEFDYAVGNLSDDDYRELKGRYEKKAISLLKTLDEVDSAGRKNGRRKGRGRVAGQAMREEGQRSEGPACPECGRAIGYEDRFCASCGAELGGFARPGSYQEDGLLCPACGEPCEEDDAFCASCGAQLLLSDGPSEVFEEDFGEETPYPVVDETAQTPGQSHSHPRRRSRRGGRRRRTSSDGLSQEH